MKTVAGVIIDHMAPLDLFGPVQAFNVAFGTDTAGASDFSNPLYHTITIGKEQGAVATGNSGAGPAVIVDYSFWDEVAYDILLIPGGMGTRGLVDDKDFIESLRLACSKASIVASVCTGAALLAKTGLLNGKAATTNKMAWSWVIEQGPDVNWRCPPRWVNLIDKQTKSGIITSAGVSAGIDMTLAIIEELDGVHVAENAAELMEYNWTNDSANDPFSRLCQAR